MGWIVIGIVILIVAFILALFNGGTSAHPDTIIGMTILFVIGLIWFGVSVDFYESKKAREEKTAYYEKFVPDLDARILEYDMKILAEQIKTKQDEYMDLQEKYKEASD